MDEKDALTEYREVCALIKQKEKELEVLKSRRNTLKIDYPKLGQVQLNYGAYFIWMQFQKAEWRVDSDRQQGVDYAKPFEFHTDYDGKTAKLLQTDKEGRLHSIEAPYHCFHLICEE
jgi:hypothetical protein